MSTESGLKTSEYGFRVPVSFLELCINISYISLNKGTIATLVLEDTYTLLSELQLLLSLAIQLDIRTSPAAVQIRREDAPAWDLVKESTQILRLHSRTAIRTRTT